MTNKHNRTPKEIVAELNQHIIGQDEAKRAVAIAVRNRWRRSQLPHPLCMEVTPKNILMIGPTGVGKTEIARRLAKLTQAPFLKVEATKFTEVGYVGRDVDSIIRDLMDVAIKMQRDCALLAVKEIALQKAHERILNILVPPIKQSTAASEENAPTKTDSTSLQAARETFKRKLESGTLDDKEIELEVSHAARTVEIMGAPGMEEMMGQLQNIMENMAKHKKVLRTMPIEEARKILQEEEASKLVNEEEIRAQAVENVEQNGMVFLDEIDKIARKSGQQNDVSREGVQRDLLPLVEGSTVPTKYGMIKTDHILFIASGAFHLAKPSDLIPELQGRFPVRVELSALKKEDFERILTEPTDSLTKQYAALLQTEGLTLLFLASGIKRLAEIAEIVNAKTENIGARRLHTLLERLTEELAFSADERAGETVEISAEYVDAKLAAFLSDEDLSRAIL
eukprot:TRINITY_DN16225_c0_g1_i1.p1 TRINITY_DN16225_c0_g1~~TRINITY_DN16225_c0_g1_i1.p1  ORF type:complete len:453 (+),score=-32.02 TRINITY_DN16225_c0_g1_i1:608-1966(+)